MLFKGEILALCEVKASPLVAYPVIIPLERELFEEDEQGQPAAVGQHRKTDIPNLGNVSLYVPSLQQRFDLGQPGSADYPMKVFRQAYADDLQLIASIIDTWAAIYAGYGRGWRQDVDRRVRYLTFGCGSPIDDSKNLPGIDRTDDIKKGIYQMLKLGEHFVYPCKTGALKCALVANIHAVRHYADYVQGIEDVTWSHDDRFVGMENEPEWRKVKKLDLVQLYDASLALTRPHFRNAELSDDFGLDRLIERLQV